MFFKFSKTLAQIQSNLTNNFARTSLKIYIYSESQQGLRETEVSEIS